MIVRVIPLEYTQPDGLKFDVIVEDGYAKTFTVDAYKIRHYRGASIAEIIEQIVLDYVEELGYSKESVQIVFC